MTDRDPNRILIVGGAAEALDLAQALPKALVRLSGGERTARIWPGPVSLGPVTPEWLRARRIAAVIEAAHPCDAPTAHATAGAARALGLAHLQLVRPPWRAGRQDGWIRCRDTAEAVQVIPRGARVFATLGRDALPALRGHPGMVLARVIGRAPPVFPLARGRFVPGEGPFSVAGEMRLLRLLRIDWLVLRNAGGPGGWPKLEAARRLQLPVAMIDRPRRPDGPRVTTVKEALTWLQTRKISAG